MLSRIQEFTTTGRHVTRRLYAHKHRTSQIRLGYIGAHSGKNLGDDLLKDAALSVLGDRLDLVDYELSWHERRLARVGLSGKRYFNGCVLGGGTLISNFWAGKVERALAQDLPMWTLGTGAGACGFVDDEEQDLSRWAPMLKQFIGLGVRGPRSIARLEEMGVTGATVIGDLAFALTTDSIVPASDPPILALNMSWPATHDIDRGERAWITHVGECLPDLVNSGWRVRPFIMNEQDREPTEFVLNQLPAGSIDPIVRPNHVGLLLDLLAECRMTIAVRLHAAVLSCCAGVPPLLLGYRDKCLDFMESVELGNWVLPMKPEHLDALQPRMHELAEASEGMRKEVWQKAQGYKSVLKAYTESIADSLIHD